MRPHLSTALATALALMILALTFRPSAPQPTGAYEALETWTRSRAYPDADISQDAHYRGWEAARATIRPVDAPDAPGPWTSLGPTNFSGRMIAVTFNPLNPNTVYAGAAAGGLWRTRSAGLNADWQLIPTGYPVLGVCTIELSAADTNVLYIGTGETYNYNASIGGTVIRTTRGSYGIGILKSTNGGLTWTKSLDWSYSQRRGVQQIRINPRNPQVVYAGTSEGVFKSTNAGGSWVQLNSVLMVRDLLIHPTDTSLVLMAAGNFGTPGNGVYRSTDGGTSFGIIAGLTGFSGYPRLEMWKTDPNVVYASLPDSTTGNGRLLRSVNFGVSWDLISTQAVYGVQGWYSQFVAVHPTDTTRVMRGGQSLWRSMDGGRNATELPYASEPWADFHNYAHHPTNPDILYIADDGGIWRSINYGLNFTFAGGGLLTTQFYNGFSASTTDSNLALGHVQDHFGWMYIGSPVWPEGGVDEVGWTGTHPVFDSIMYAVTRNGGTLYRSVDYWASATSASSGITGSNRAWNTPFIISWSNPNVLYFGRNVVSRTTNGGIGSGAWTATNGGSALNGTNPVHAMAMSFTSSDTVYVGTAPVSGRARLFRTGNGGTSWVDITATTPDRYPMDLAVDPSDSRIVYAAFGGVNTGHFFVSTNAGGTWTDITGSIPDVVGTAVVVDPYSTSHVYAGTDIGVFVSTNRGASWSSYQEGLPEAVIAADLVISRADRSLYVATHSNGVWKRKLLSQQPTGVEELAGDIPQNVRLDQNFPNPFNPVTAIRYEVPVEGRVSLKVFDAAGREVAALVDGIRSAGRHREIFDARQLSSGVYFYRLETARQSITRKMILAR